MEERISQVIQGMRKNGFEVVELRLASEACEQLLSRIPQGSVVGVGGSVSVRDTNILEELSAKGCTVLTSWGADPLDVSRIREESRKADFYLSSANAITKDGKLVLVDGIGNRVGAIADGPKVVFFVVSHSKVVDGGLNTALARIKKTACPQNARRIGLKTPCALTGFCGETDCEDSMCRLTLAVDRVPKGRSMTVFFVEEPLGY